MTNELPHEVLRQSRLASVEASGLASSAPDEAFDRLAHLAAELLQTPYAFVTAVDDRRSWYKSFVGAPPGAQHWVSVERSFCQYVIGSESECLFAEAREHPLTRDNPSVDEMGVVAWAGFPVRAPDGEILGTLCVADTKPRQWTDRDRTILETLAGTASTEVALRAALDEEQAQRARAEEVAEELQRTNAELAETATRAEKLAATLSASLLPPRLEAPDGLNAAARFRAATTQTVTGDFYDLFRVDDQWAAVLGDVVGKGPEAATFASEVRYSLRAVTAHNPSPAHVLTSVSQLVHGRADFQERFATAVCVSLQRAGEHTWTVRLALAGHPRPLLRRANGEVRAVGAPGLPLGLFADVHLSETELTLGPGDLLLLYTDGVVEARAGAEEFGEQRLKQVVRTATGEASDLVRQVIDASVEFGEDGSRDDMATLVLVAGPPQSPILPP